MEASTPEPTKLFVGGINDSLKEEEIRAYFGRFGDVTDLVVVRDKITGNVRGFGFVEFLDPSSAQKALDEKDHVIGDRTVEVKTAIPRSEHRQNYQSPRCQYSIFGEHENGELSNNATNSYCNNEIPTKSKKIFVGGLSSSMTEDEFRSYFERFGRITDAVIMYDNTTRRPRGFGFVTFDSVEAVEGVMQNKFHELNNKVVEVKIAVPKDNNNQMNFIDSDGNLGGGRGYAFSNHRRGFYPPPSPGGYGHYHNYPPPVPAFFYGTNAFGYGVGPYGGISFGDPFIHGRNTWNTVGMVSARSPVMYGNASMYPGYYTGGSAYGARYHGNGDECPANGNVRITELNDGTSDVGNEKLDLVEQAS